MLAGFRSSVVRCFSCSKRAFESDKAIPAEFKRTSEFNYENFLVGCKEAIDLSELER